MAPEEAAGWAELLIEEFGGFRAVLDAPQEKICRLTHSGSEVARLLAAVRDGMDYALMQRLTVRPVVSTSEELSNYLRFALGSSRIEQVRALYLDVRNFLIRDELVARGTLNQVAIYPRQVMKRALELDAGGIIIVHNHPSGDPSPSSNDHEVTRALAWAAKSLDIILHDHVIVGCQRISSLRALGYL